MTASFTNLKLQFTMGFKINLANPFSLPTNFTFNNIIVTAGNITIKIGSFLTLTANNVTINPQAGANQDLISFGGGSTPGTYGLSATLNAGPLTLTGGASNFAIEGNGTLLAKSNFVVALAAGQNTASSVSWPTWLPIQNLAVALSWTDFNNNPNNFTLTLSATVTKPSFLPSTLTFTGVVTGLQIDVQKLSNGEFPIVGIGSVGITVGGTLFGGPVSATVILGIASFDAGNNLVASTDTTTPVASRQFYAALSGTVTIPGLGQLSMRLALWQYGPLSFYIELPTQIILDPETGLAITNLRGGFDLGATLATPNTPQDLRSGQYQPPLSQTAATWNAQLLQQMSTLLKAGNTSIGNMFAPPIEIHAGATLFDAYLSTNSFRADIDLTIGLVTNTDGSVGVKILINGNFTFGNSLTVKGYLFADLSQVQAGQGKFLFLVDMPGTNPIYSVYGTLSFQFLDANHNLVTPTAATPATYFNITVSGGAVVNVGGLVGFQVTGTLSLTFSSTSFEVEFSGFLTITSPAIGQVAEVAGDIVVNNNNGSIEIWGVIYGQFDMDLKLPSGMEFSAHGAAEIDLNTTGSPVNVTLFKSAPPATTVTAPTVTTPSSGTGTSGGQVTVQKTFNLAPNSFELLVGGVADLTLNNSHVFRVTGALDFKVTQNDLTFFVNSELDLGPVSSPLMKFSATGLLYISYSSSSNPAGPGFAAYIHLTAAGSLAGVPNTSFDASLTLDINTFGAAVNYTVPDLLKPYVTTATVTIPAGPPNLDGSLGGAGPYVVVSGNGQLTLLGLYHISGAFRIQIDSTGFQMQLAGTIPVNVIGTLTVNGSLTISSAGLAGVLNMTLNYGNSAIGFTGTMQAEINTGSTAVTIQRFTVDASGNVIGSANVSLPGFTFRLFIGGKLNIVGIVTLKGAFELTVTSTKIVVYINGQLSLFGIGLGLRGFAAIYFDSSPGIALDLALSLSTPLSLPLFSLSGNFEFRLNTTSVQRTETFSDGTSISVAPHFAQVAVTNVSLNILGLSFSGSLIITLSGSYFRIEIPASNPLSVSLLGIVTLSAYGFIDSNGEFDITASAHFGIGNDFIGLSANISIEVFSYYDSDGIHHAGFHGHIDGSAHIIGIGIGASGDLNVDSGTGDVSLSLSVSVDFGLFTISGSHTFEFGTLVIPPTPPVLASYSPNGVLTLNLTAATTGDPNFSIQSADYVDPSTSANPKIRADGVLTGQTVTITAFGVTQTYAGVTEIDFAPGGGNVTVTVGKDVTAAVKMTTNSSSPVNFYDYGSGAATVTAGGSGSVVIFAGLGGNNITKTGSGAVTITLGSGNNTVLNSGTGGTMTVQIPTADGIITITGGSASSTAVYVGSTSGSGGSLSGILSALTVNGAGNTTVWLDDTGSTVARTGTMSYDGSTYGTFSGFGMGSGGSVKFKGLTALNVLFNAKNDTLNLTGNPAGLVNLHLGAGQNQINVGDATHSLNSIVGSLNVIGSGNDTLTVTDVAGAANKTGSLSGTTLSGLGMGGSITYSQLATLNLTLDNFGNAFTISNTSAGTKTTVNGGSAVDTFVLQTDSGVTFINVGGRDQINVQAIGAATTITKTTGTAATTIYVGTKGPVSASSPAANNGVLSGIQAALTVAGQGQDNLYLDDTGDVAAINGTLSATKLTGLGMAAAGIQYSGIAQLQLNLGAGTGAGASQNNFNVVSTSSITNTKLIRPATTNAANFNLGSQSPALHGFVDNIQGAIIIVAGGKDVLNVDDTGATRSKNGPLAGFLTASTLKGLGMGLGITSYSGLVRININLGGSANVFTIQSTHAGTEVHLTTDANDIVNVQSTASATFVTTLTGSNTINVGSLAPNTGGLLSGIQGALTITGTGNDTLNLDDTGSVAGVNNTGVLASTNSSSTLDGINMGKIDGTHSITYTGLAQLNLNFGAANYKLAITGTYNNSTGSVVTTVNTGRGTNMINIGSAATPAGTGSGNLAGIQGQLNIVGGGTDTVNIDNTGATTALPGYLTGTQLSGLGMGPGISIAGSGFSLGTSLFAAADFAGLTAFASNFFADSVQQYAPYQTGYVVGTSGIVVTPAVSYLATLFQSLAPSSVATMLNIYSTPRQLQDAFIAALNAVVQSASSIYNTTVFTNAVTLSAATQALMAQNPTQATQRAQLNRLLLNDLFGSLLPQPQARLLMLNINLPNLGNNFFVQGTSAWVTNLNLGTGTNHIAVGTLAQIAFNAITAKLDVFGNPVPGAGTSASTGSVLSGMVGDLNINGSGHDTLNIDDTGSMVGRQGVMDPTSLALNNLGIIRFTGVSALDISFGQGNDQLQVSDTMSSADVYTSTFVASDFYQNFPQLLLALTTQTHPNGVSGYLWNHIGSATQAILSNPNATMAQKEAALVTALNLIINGSSIYDATVFNGIQLSNATLTLLANSSRTADQTARLNRLLLQDAYPGLIATSVPNPVIYINGDGGNDVFAVFGTHCAVQINGGSGDDTFYIFSNSSPLEVNGDDGDDTFYIFASVQSQEADTSVDGGTGGGAIYNYRSNGHVAVDGGTGFNRLFVYGTILDDVITLDGYNITGAGLDISFQNVSELDIAGLQGSDTFYIKSIVTPTRILGDANLPNFPDWIRIPPHFFDGHPVNMLTSPPASGVLTQDFSYQISVLNLSALITLKASATSGNKSVTDLINELTAAINATIFANEFLVYQDPITGNIMLQLLGSQTYNDTFYIGWRDVQIPYTSTDLALPGSLSGIQASLSIVAGAQPGSSGYVADAVKTIYIDDSSDNGNQNFTMTTTVDAFGVVNQVGALIGQLNSSAMGLNGVIYWDTTSTDVNIQLGSGTNTFTANGNLAGSQTTVNGGPGNEHFILNGQNPLLGLGFLSPLQLHGNSNTFAGDTLTVNTAVSGQNLILTGSSLDGLGVTGATIRFDTLEFLTVNAIGGNNSFTINGDSIPTIINGGPHSDTFTINANTASLTINGLNDAGNFVINANSGILQITGGKGANSFTVNGNGGALTLTGGIGDDIFVINGNSSSLTANGGEGDDTFTVNSLSSPATLNGGLGNDSFTVNAPLAAVLTVNGGGDAGDVLTINGTTGNDNFTITRNTVSGVGAIINYGTTNLTINGLAGDDTFLVSSTAAGITRIYGGIYGNDIFNIQANTGALYLTGGAVGNNTFNFGSLAPVSGGNLAGLVGAIFVTGGSNLMRLITLATTGFNTVNFDDSGDVAGGIGTLTSSALTGFGMGAGVTFLAVDVMNVYLGPGNDRLNIQSTNSRTVTTIRTGAGVNTVNIGSLMPTGGGNVEGIQGVLTLIGGGNDTLNVDDTGAMTDQSATLTPTLLTGLGMAASGIVYSGVANLNISLGRGNDTFLLINTSALTNHINGNGGNDTFNIQATFGALYLNGGDGSNTFNLGSVAPLTGGTLSGLVGGVFIMAGTNSMRQIVPSAAGTNTLNLDDAGDATNATGTLGAFSLTGLGMGTGITFVSVDVLNLNLGSGNDMLTITGATQSTVSTIDGGTGTNSAIFNFSGGFFSPDFTLLRFATATLSIGGDFTGLLNDAGAITTASLAGSFTGTGVMNVGSIATMTIGGDLAGHLNVIGLLGTLTVNGGTPGVIVAGDIHVITVLAGYGNTVLNVTENGVLREITATPVNGGDLPGTLHFAFVYDSQTAADPQLAIRITDTAPAARSFNLALVVLNSASAKFNLARVDSLANGPTGISNISLQGNMLAKLSAPELLLFTDLTSTSRSGVVLPADSITGVEVSNILTIGSIDVAGIEGLAFAILTTAAGSTVNVSSPLGSANNLQTLWNLLGSNAAINPATDTFVLVFNETQNVRLFAHDNTELDLQQVMTLTDETNDNLSVTAYVKLVPTANNSINPLVQSVTLMGNGGSINSVLSIANLISTGPLGDVTISASAGSTVNNAPGLGNVTAPSIFGSINVTLAGIYGVIQTTSGDLGQTVLGTNGKISSVTTIFAKGAITGQIISRGNLVSSVQTSGAFSGVIAAQGDIGAIQRDSSGNAVITSNALTRFGGITVSGNDSGQIIALGNLFGDVTVSGTMTGRLAVQGQAVAGLTAARLGILGNLTIGSFALGSAIISGGLVSDATGATNTHLGSPNGFVAARGGVNLRTTTLPAANLLQNIASGANLAALNATFTSGSSPLMFDTGGSLQGLILIENDLANLQDNAGTLGGTMA